MWLILKCSEHDWSGFCWSVLRLPNATVKDLTKAHMKRMHKPQEHGRVFSSRYQQHVIDVIALFKKNTHTTAEQYNVLFGSHSSHATCTLLSMWQCKHNNKILNAELQLHI